LRLLTYVTNAVDYSTTSNGLNISADITAWPLDYDEAILEQDDWWDNRVATTNYSTWNGFTRITTFFEGVQGVGALYGVGATRLAPNYYFSAPGPTSIAHQAELYMPLVVFWNGKAVANLGSATNISLYTNHYYYMDFDGVITNDNPADNKFVQIYQGSVNSNAIESFYIGEKINSLVNPVNLMTPPATPDLTTQFNYQFGDEAGSIWLLNLQFEFK